jgi:hypothetical protein
MSKHSPDATGRSVSNLAAYKAEASWRSRHAGNGEALRETVLVLLRASPVSWRDLTSGAR